MLNHRSTLLAAVVTTASLLGCAAEPDEQSPLGETIVDGAADSWSSPTAFGRLFQGVWQRGELAPTARVRFPAWGFRLDAAAKVTVTTRQAPTDEVVLHAVVIYLYEQRTAGTWQRIAKSEPGEGFPALTRDLAAGAYRVIVKGLANDDAGELLLRLDCSGAGCAQEPECLVGETFAEPLGLEHGALIDHGSTPLTRTSEIADLGRARILAALHQSAHTEVTDLAQAFAAVDAGQILRHKLYDTLAGRNLTAYTYAAGGETYGAYFLDRDTEVVASIHDGAVAACEVPAQACVFGASLGEAAYMPGLTLVREHEIDAVGDVPSAAVGAQIVVAASGGDNVPTLAEAIENADEGTIYVDELRHSDGRTFTQVMFYSGDTSTGAIFAGSSKAPVATINDGDVEGCTAY